MSAWNLSLNIQGNAPEVTIFDGGFQIAAANAISGNAQVGVIYTYGNTSVTVNITGALPNTPFLGMISGLASHDPTDLSALTGQSSLTQGVITAYDGPTLISETGLTHSSGQGFYPGIVVGGVPIPASSPQGTFNVLNWASVLLGIRQTGGSPALITLRWFADPSGVRLVGQRSMILSVDVVTAVATIPNLGPYLQVVVNGIGGGYTWNASLVASNRLVNDIFGGNFNPYLVEVYGMTQPANTAITQAFGTLYGGPIRVSIQNAASSPGNLNAQVQSMGTDGAFHAKQLQFFSGGVAPGGYAVEQLIIPPVPCLFSATTAAAVGTYTFSFIVFSSATGAT